MTFSGISAIRAIASGGQTRRISEEVEPTHWTPTQDQGPEPRRPSDPLGRGGHDVYREPSQAASNSPRHPAIPGAVWHGGRSGGGLGVPFSTAEALIEPVASADLGVCIGPRTSHRAEMGALRPTNCVMASDRCGLSARVDESGQCRLKHDRAASTSRRRFSSLGWGGSQRFARCGASAGR